MAEILNNNEPSVGSKKEDREINKRISCSFLSFHSLSLSLSLPFFLLSIECGWLLERNSITSSSIVFGSERPNRFFFVNKECMNFFTNSRGAFQSFIWRTGAEKGRKPDKSG